MIRPEILSQSWPIKPLGDAVEFLDHLRRPITARDRKAGIYPYYGANGQQDSVADYLFDEPLILLAEDGGYFGDQERTIAYRVEGKCWVNNHAHVLRPKQGVDIGFLCRQLEHYDVTPFINGATREKLTKSSALKIPVTLPPLAEQKRIAAILDKADAIRRKRQQSIKLADDFLRATFLDMFGDPVTNPKGWKVKIIDSLVEDIKTWNPATKPDSQFWYIDISAIDQETKIIKTAKQIYGKDAPSRARQLIKAGDILVSTVRPNLNAVAFVEDIFEGGTASTGFCVLRPRKDSITSQYLFALVRSKTFINSMIQQATGASYPAVNCSIVRSWTAPIPPLELQKQYNTQVERTLSLRKKEDVNLSYVDGLFNSLTQRAFRGEL